MNDLEKIMKTNRGKPVGGVRYIKMDFTKKQKAEIKEFKDKYMRKFS